MAGISINIVIFMDYNLKRTLEIKSILTELPCPLGFLAMA